MAAGGQVGRVIVVEVIVVIDNIYIKGLLPR